jgi:predicted permease
MRLSTRTFRALLKLYPGEFRDEYGREVAMVFADRYRDATSVWQRVAVWIEAIVGVVKEAPQEHVHMVVQDLRFALRMARRSPVFTAAAVLTLALGIGANTAVFQLIEAVGLRTLPVKNPHELAEARIVGGNGGFGVNPNDYGQLTRPMWEEIRNHQQAFSEIFAWSWSGVRVGELSDLRPAKSISVSGEFFQVLGVHAWRGRLIAAGDDQEGCPATKAVVSYPYWQNQLGSREIDGLSIKVNGQAQEVIGVTPPGFFGLTVGDSFDIAMPLCKQNTMRRELFNMSVMGRLRPGWTLERASAHLEALSPAIVEATAPTEYNADAVAHFKKFRLGAFAAARGVSSLRSDYQTSLQLLLAITGLVLLIACANLANLMLARASAREREVAVRLAMGASRIRLVRQFLAESFLLAITGAALGVLLARELSHVLVWALASRGVPPALFVATNWRVLTFTAVTAVATCVVFGLAPALRARRIAPAVALKAGGRGTTAGRERFSTQRAMVIVQIAVSVVLLVAAFLFVRSFYNLVTFNPGMRMSGITIGNLGAAGPSAVQMPAPEYRRLLLAEIASVPGISSVGTTTNVPLLGGSWGHGVRVGNVDKPARFTWVSPGYFPTMEIPLLEGRDFAFSDVEASTRVAIVNQAFVREFTNGANPIGQLLTTAPEPQFPSGTYQIVGVVPDTKYSNLRGSISPSVFAPDTQYPPQTRGINVMIRSDLDPMVVATNVKRRLADTFPEVISQFFNFQAEIHERLVRERLLAMLAGFFGVLAAVLAMIGLYGMIAFAASQRRQEIGVRLALGATRRQVVTMMMREAASLLTIGIVVGVGLSLLASRSAASLLFGLTPHDPVTLVTACGLLIMIAGIASFLPARGASRLDPLTALRQD